MFSLLLNKPLRASRRSYSIYMEDAWDTRDTYLQVINVRPRTRFTSISVKRGFSVVDSAVTRKTS